MSLKVKEPGRNAWKDRYGAEVAETLVVRFRQPKGSNVARVTRGREGSAGWTAELAVGPKFAFVTMLRTYTHPQQ